MADAQNTLPHSVFATERFAFGLTEVEVRRLQDILRRESHVELTLEETWARGIELLSFTQMLLESLPPEVT